MSPVTHIPVLGSTRPSQALRLSSSSHLPYSLLGLALGFSLVKQPWSLNYKAMGLKKSVFSRMGGLVTSMIAFPSSSLGSSDTKGLSGLTNHLMNGTLFRKSKNCSWTSAGYCSNYNSSNGVWHLLNLMSLIVCLP